MEEKAMKSKTKKVKQSNNKNIEAVVLNNEQRDTLIDMLNNPPEPNEELKSLFH